MEQRKPRQRVPSPPKINRPKPMNPLLTVSMDDIPLPVISVMPVAPPPPAVHQDESSQPAEIDSFIGQAVPPKPSTAVLQPHNIPPNPSIFSPTQETYQPSQQQQQQQQPQKQSYFTSILSSLPSLSYITGDDSRSQQQQQQQHQQHPPSEPPTFYGSPATYNVASYGALPPPPQQQHQQNPYGYQSVLGLGDFNAGAATLQFTSLQPPPPSTAPQAPPPVSLPPSGGSASYRLGNQRRLKYAPVPDLASSRQQYQPQQLPFQPVISPAAAPPPPTTFYNPNLQQQQQQQPSAVYQPPPPQQQQHFDASQTPPSAPLSSQSSSLQSSFRSSPITAITSPVSTHSVNSPSTSCYNIPAISNQQQQQQSAPQAIPSSRFHEPTATPQNTPADAYSGFSAYRQQQQQRQQQQEFSAGLTGYGTSEATRQPPVLQAVQEGVALDQTFTPISAAKVTEKLENLILAEQNDDTQSVKSELSAEVATITSGIIQEDTKIAECTEELQEIDLNSSFSEPVSVSAEAKEEPLVAFTVPSAASTFFSDPNPPSSEPPTYILYNPYTSDQQQKTKISDSFSFVEKPSSSPTPSASAGRSSAPPPPLASQQPYNSAPSIVSARSLGSRPPSGQTFGSRPSSGTPQTLSSAPIAGPPTFGSRPPSGNTPTFGSAPPTDSHQTFGSRAPSGSTPTFGSAPPTNSQQTFGSRSPSGSIQLFTSGPPTDCQQALGAPPQSVNTQIFTPAPSHPQVESIQTFSSESFAGVNSQEFTIEPLNEINAVPGSFGPSTTAGESQFLNFDSTQATSSVPPIDNTQLFGQSTDNNQPSIFTPPVATKEILNVDQQSYVEQNLKAENETNFIPQSLWGSNQTQSSSTVLNPIYGTPTQAPPTFFNPSQFQSPVSQSFPPTTANTFSPSHYGSTATDDFNNTCFQLPLAAIVQESFNAVPEPTGSATLSPVQMSLSPLSNSRSPQDTVPPSLENLASGQAPEKQMQYRPVYHHWFYRREVETKTLWIPFSMHDSLNLEGVHNSNEIGPETKVATDGGRYDVEILRRQRSPVYWTGPITEVRRCSWFYKGNAESRYTPYEESLAARLEEEFKQACANNAWNKRIELSNGEYIMFHSPQVQAHYLQATTPELAASWGNNSGSEDNAYSQGATSRPRVVKRGMDEFNIDDGEPERVDHLLFLVHGIGSVCDLKFRTVEEVVDEFRSISLQLVQSHYRNSSEQGMVNRIEVLPISWHATLHSGIDKKLQMISLESIPKLRHFTNDTLLDILFYTSPVYCETIMQTVGNELNRLYSLFNQRNPEFQGNVYLGGHSLGSLIMFDLLCHQTPTTPDEEANGQREKHEETSSQDSNRSVVKPLPAPVLKRRLSKRVSYVMGVAGTGQPYINYPQLAFKPCAFFALGSPIGMFVTVRGIDNLGEDFSLPTCPAFFNIFHPFDPVAYRVESLINPEAHKYRPMLIPHHKGRKRMHLELKETMARVGADLKQRLLDSVRSTWNSVYQLAMFHRQDNQQTLEQEIEKVVEEQLNKPPTDALHSASHNDADIDIKIGKLNGGRRIDYVLQEAPFEYINEYLFALTSHVCYWESEDTMLLILKEIYGSMGIQTDAQLPQQMLSIERVSPSFSASPSNATSPTTAYSPVDPTAPITTKAVGPPPMTGFVKKS